MTSQWEAKGGARRQREGRAWAAPPRGQRRRRQNSQEACTGVRATERARARDARVRGRGWLLALVEDGAGVRSGGGVRAPRTRGRRARHASAGPAAARRAASALSQE